MSYQIMYPNAISIMDAGRVSEDNLKLASMVDYLVCSKEFAETVTNIKLDGTNYQELYDKMREQFSKNIIVTLENQGCLYSYDEELRIMPAIEVKTIDSTGAGDIFHGAFTYGVASNWDLETILKFSNITAGLSVTKIGSRNSIFELEEVMKKYDEFK